MTYVVKDECIKCKHTDCVEVCPVDCFYEGVNTLVINPDECIDRGVCEPECPVEAIVADTDTNVAKSELDYWIHVNTEYAKTWPNITKKKDALPEHEEFHPDNFPNGKKDLFDENPGEGD